MMRRLIHRCRQLVRRRRFAPLLQRQGGAAAYWEHRASTYGRRSVLDVRYRDEEYNRVTERQKEILYPLCRAALNGTEQFAVDFGCGPGRFTGGLAGLIGGDALGVDPVARLIDLAPSAPNTRFLRMARARIPVEDGAADLVWVCLVLGGLTDPGTVQKAIAEIQRVLKPGGLLFLVENTSNKPDGEHWVFRSQAEYQALFPLVSLRILTSYEDFDEKISVLAGRKHV